MRKLAILMIRLYQLVLSPFLGPCCRFSPSCSAYAIACIEKFGVFKGATLSAKRLLKCHPLGPYGYDPPPKLETETRNPLMRKA